MLGSPRTHLFQPALMPVTLGFHHRPHPLSNAPTPALFLKATLLAKNGAESATLAFSRGEMLAVLIVRIIRLLLLHRKSISSRS